MNKKQILPLLAILIFVTSIVTNVALFKGLSNKSSISSEIHRDPIIPLLVMPRYGIPIDVDLRREHSVERLHYASEIAKKVCGLGKELIPFLQIVSGRVYSSDEEYFLVLKGNSEQLKSVLSNIQWKSMDIVSAGTCSGDMTDIPEWTLQFGKNYMTSIRINIYQNRNCNTVMIYDDASEELFVHSHVMDR